MRLYDRSCSPFYTAMLARFPLAGGQLAAPLAHQTRSPTQLVRI
jgi:hypothetical protein